MALIKSDAIVAETLFKQHLDSTNPEVSGMAIRDLGTIKSKRYKNEIQQKINSDNEIVRWSVVDYLGHFQDDESIGLLKRIRNSDKSEMIRNAATVRLNPNPQTCS
jgi:HEAT repeat protein